MCPTRIGKWSFWNFSWHASNSKLGQKLCRFSGYNVLKKHLPWKLCDRTVLRMFLFICYFVEYRVFFRFFFYNNSKRVHEKITTNYSSCYGSWKIILLSISTEAKFDLSLYHNFNYWLETTNHSFLLNKKNPKNV